ncbi:hypothetical protein ACVWXM_001689 [Bradyrhizobium sp. GM7.3]
MFCGRRALCPVAVMRKLMVSPSPIGSIVSVPPRGIVCCETTSMLSSSLTRFFGSKIRGRFQVIEHLPSHLDVAARHGLGIAEIDLRAGRAGRTKSEAAELEASGGGFRALAYQVECELAVVGLGIVVEHFEPIDDGADRADEIVADPRAQQRSEFERIWSGGGSG